MQSYNKEEISNRKIILWGGSMYGKIAYDVITQIYGGEVYAIIDNKYKELEWSNIQVIRSKELEQLQDIDLLICAANSFENVCKEALSYEKNGFHIYDIKDILEVYESEFADAMQEMLSQYMYGDIDFDEIKMRYYYYADGKESKYGEKLYLPYCVLCITTKCSLCCDNCAAFVTKYSRQEDYSLDYLKNTFQLFLDAIDGIMELELMGGEPFLSKEFNDILQWCILEKKIRAIRIVTNATVIPPESTWKLMSHNKVKLVIDNYGELSRAYQEMINLSYEYHIRYEQQKLQTWYQIEPLIDRQLTAYQLKEKFAQCNFRTCVGVTAGKLYHCNVAGHMQNAKLIEQYEEDYIDLQRYNNVEDLRKNIKKYLKKEYMESCNYCSYDAKRECPVAKQIR